MSLKIQLPDQSFFSPKAVFSSPLLLGIGFSLMTLTGCQTTTGIQQSSSQSVVRQPASSKAPTSSRVPTTTPSKTTTPPKSKSTVTTYPKTTPTPTRTPTTSPPSSISVSPATDPIADDPTQGHYPNPNSTDADAHIDYGNGNATGNATGVTNTAPVNTISPPTPDASTAPIKDTRTPQQSLIEQARRNSNTGAKSMSSIQNGDNIPAFRKLMNTGVSQLKQGQLSAAQTTFTRAQRLAPQSSSVYFYLGQVALKQKQYIKAEAMARRGLVVAQSSSRKQGLWQLILKSAQLRGNQNVIEEAQAQLAR